MRMNLDWVHILAHDNYIPARDKSAVYNSTYVMKSFTLGSFWFNFDDVETIKTRSLMPTRIDYLVTVSFSLAMTTIGLFLEQVLEQSRACTVY